MTQDINLVYVMEVDETVPLAPSTLATRSSLKFASTDDQVVSVSSDGSLVAHSEGTVEITVSGGAPASLTITVVPPAPPAPRVRDVRPRIRFDATTLDAQRSFFREALEDPCHPLHRDTMEFLEEADKFTTEERFFHEFNIQEEIRTYEGPMPFAMPKPLEQPRGFKDYPFWTKLSRQLEKRLITLSAAWILTEDEHYATVAKQQLLSICSWSKWHEYDIANNNLSLPHFTIAVATAYDELFDLLSDEERDLVQQALVTLGILPMTYWFDSRFDHNINVLMNAGTLIGVLAIADAVPGNDKHFHSARKTLLWYMDQRLTSSESEGHTYVCYAMDYILKAGTALAASTGDTSLLDHQYSATELPAYLSYFSAAESGMAPLADSYASTDPSSLAVMLLRYGPDPRLEWLLSRREYSAANILPYISSAEQIKTSIDPELPTSRLFETIGWAALRDDWSRTGTILTFTASKSTAGHSHYDQNNIVLNVGDEWLLTDSGYQVYSAGPAADFTLQTIGHNGLLVNGVGQSSKGGGEILGHDFGSEIDSIFGDATIAYDGRVQRWHRHIIFRRHAYVLIVDDVVAVNDSDALELRFHTLGKIVPGGAQPASGGVHSFEFKGAKQSLGLQFASSQPVEFSEGLHPGAEQYGPWIAASTTGQSTWRLATLLVPGGSQAELLEMTTDNDVVMVSVRGDREITEHRIDLRTRP